MQHVQQNVGSNIIKTHSTLDEGSLFIFRLDRVHSHITFCNILQDEPTQVRVYVLVARIIAFLSLLRFFYADHQHHEYQSRIVCNFGIL